MIGRRVMCGFTLLELLVVMIVITVLVAMLLPAYSRTGNHGRTSVCKSNVKQFGLAMSLYRTDFDGFFPTHGLRSAVGTDELRGLGSLCLLYDQYIAHRGIFRCPSTLDDPRDITVGLNIDENVGLITAKPAGCSYAYDSQKAGLGERKLPASTLARLPILADKPDPTCRIRNSANHGNTGQNVLYFDGHVEWAATPNAGLNRDDIYTHWDDKDGPTVLAYSDTYVTQ